MSRRRINELWQSYRGVVLAGAHQTEQQEMESWASFYAGANSMLRMVVHAFRAGAPTAADMALVEELHAELEEVTVEIKRVLEKHRRGASN